MQGRILSASPTASQGIVLGDDGVRYSFTPSDWQHNTVRATAGMVVGFRAEGAFARDVYTVGEAIVPPTPQPVYAAPPTAVAPRVYASPPPAIQGADRFNPAAPPRPARPGPPEPKSRRSLATPGARMEARKLRKTLALLCLLGAVGAIIGHMQVGTRMTAATTVALVLVLITLPIQYLAYPVYFVLAVVLLATGDWKIDEYAHNVHLLREHGLFPSKKCKEECFHDTRSISHPAG